MAWGFFFAIAQESKLCSFPGKTAMNQLTKQGTKLFPKVLTHIGFRFSSDIQSPGMILSDKTLQSKSWLTKLSLETGFTDFMQINTLLWLIYCELSNSGGIRYGEKYTIYWIY